MPDIIRETKKKRLKWEVYGRQIRGTRVRIFQFAPKAKRPLGRSRLKREN